MEALSILKALVKSSTNLEMIGSVQMPEEDIMNYLSFFFGQGAVAYRGALIPGKLYLYAYGDELDGIFDVLIHTDDNETIALVSVDA